MRSFRSIFLASLLALPCGAEEASDIVVPDYGTEAFSQWLGELRADAGRDGVSTAILDAALSDLSPVKRVLELDANQPEFTLTFDQYVTRVASETRERRGEELLAEHRELLEAVRDRYGVQPRVIVALWGIETNFGDRLGSFDIVPALVTLSFEGRRARYFRGELLYALTILEEGHVAPDAMKGSWAGAMGQCQFMPSSFVNNAVDFDGDGRRDIWGTHADVFASAANYLRNSGWNGDRIWGREVRVPERFDGALVSLDVTRRLDEWDALGVRRANGRALPRVSGVTGSVIRPGKDEGPHFLVYDNFEAIMKWNRSTFFATTVGILSDRIGNR